MFKLFRLLKPYTLIILVILVLIFLQTIADLYLPTLMSDIIDKGVMLGNTTVIWKTGGLMLLISGAGILCAILASFLASRTATGFGRILRNRLFTHVTSFSLHEFDKLGTSTLITRTTNDITQVQMVTMMIMRLMVAAPLMAVGGIMMALSKDKTLTLVLAVAIPVLAVLIVFLARKVIPLFKVMQLKIDKINLVLREKLIGIRVIRAFNKNEYEKERFEQVNADLTNTYIRVNKIMAFLMPGLMMIMNLTSVSILWFGIIRIDRGEMEIGSLMAFSQYAMQIMFSMLMVSMMFIMVPRAQAAAARINEVLGTAPGIHDPAAAVLPGGNKHGYLEFKDVSFSYHGAENPALAHISFNASPGEVTAIIGSTGSGKSTLINLVPRFYDVAAGAILIDGVDIRAMSQEELRSRIGYISQQALIFAGTIADNIRFGKTDATDAEIRQAAETAQATDFINSLENGFAQDIAQGGTNLSGGQKQRLAIARALVRRPEIYIFDDSFSALDFKTDARLRLALKKEIAAATVLIVAQRVGTVMDADRIIVLDKGEIRGMGKHRELLASCDVYREIVFSQLAEEEIA